MKRQTINEDVVVLQAAELVTADLDGETMMMSIENGKYYGLEGVGARIWELIAVPRKVADVVEILAAEYDVAPEQCEGDTVEFINQLFSEGLVCIA